MKHVQADFLTEVLTKVGHRYTRRGRLSGRMKVGTSLNHDQLQTLYHFFGISPVRVNSKEEVHIHFERALEDAPEPEWLERISAHLGYRLESEPQQEQSQVIQTLLARLRLGFPELTVLVDELAASPDALIRLLNKESELEVTTLCFQAAETIGFLLENKIPVTFSELGARFFHKSKLLRQGEARHLLLDWLSLYCPDSDRVENEEQIWATYHVYHDRLTVNALIYGPVVYTKNGKEFDWIYQLYKQGEAATLTWANLQNIEQINWKEPRQTSPRLICCENEAPYSRLIREQRGDCLLFTSGFPSSAVSRLYELLAPRAASCFHWGDTDPNGLYIAALLHSIYPLKLFRCDIETICRHLDYLLPLTKIQQQRGAAILSGNDRFPFHKELAFTLENGWLEQENWR